MSGTAPAEGRAWECDTPGCMRAGDHRGRHAFVTWSRNQLGASQLDAEWRADARGYVVRVVPARVFGDIHWSAWVRDRRGGPVDRSRYYRTLPACKAWAERHYLAPKTEAG